MARPTISKGPGVHVIFIVIRFKVILDVLVFLHKLDATLLVINSSQGTNLMLAGAVKTSSFSKWLIFRVAEPFACRADGLLVLIGFVLFRCLVLLLVSSILRSFSTRDLNVKVFDF